MGDSFMLNRPGKRPEYFTSEEWATMVLSSDWHRRKDKVLREYDLAKKQAYQQEFDAALAHRARQAKAHLMLDDRGFVLPTDEQLIAVSRGIERMADRRRAEMLAEFMGDLQKEAA